MITDFRFIFRAICGSLVFIPAFGQSTEPATKFEAATISISPPQSTSRLARGPYLRNGRWEMRLATMVDLIAAAYNVDDDKVAGGPSWLELDRFDIAAKVNGKPSAEALRPMVQALLADRFKLVVKQDIKPAPAYLLTLGKKLNLKPSDGSGSGCKSEFKMDAPSADGQRPGITFGSTCRNMSMTEFAQQLRYLPSQLGGKPVVDKTGLDGVFDFEISFSAAMNGVNSGVTSTEALDKQLGLKLTLGTAPMEVISVERVNRTPTPDPTGAVEALRASAPPVEFEVADIKPSNPSNPRPNLQFQPGGRVNISGFPLAFFIQQAYGLRSPPAESPSWLETDRYDIIAKAPKSAIQTDLSRSNVNRGGSDVDDDTIWIMMRALVKERFKLEMHQEDRPGTGYTLIAVKPKLKKADPDSRSKWSSTAVNSRESSGPRSIQWTFQNTTMAQLALRLQVMSTLGPVGRMNTPILDATGLEGGYDFTVTYSPQAGMPGGGRGAPMKKDGGLGPAPSPSFDPELGASDPSGGLTLQEAIEKQLGLKLETQKRPIPTWVIDHIERKPTDN
jgi:uncharacterized protein (TIGR03435 family)